MRTKKILTILLAFALAFTCTVPGAASEEELPPAPPVQEDAVEELPPSEELPDAPPEVPETPPEEEETPPAQEEVPPAEPPVEDPMPDELPAPLPEEPEVPTEPEIPDAPADPAPEAPDAPAEDTQPPEEEEPPAEPEPIPEPEQPIINVLVPDRGQVVINPYRMRVDLPDGSQSQDQIVNPMQTLVNFGEVPVQVDASVVGHLSPESTAQFVPLAPLPDGQAKEIFLYTEFQTDPFLWTGWYGDMANQILVTSFGTSKANVMTLDPGAEGYFRLFGSMTDFPAEMWDTVDAPNVTVTFSFTPVVPEADEQPPAGEEPPLETNFPPEIPEAIPEVLPPDDVFFPPADDTMIPPETEVDYGQLEEQLGDYS